MDDSTGQSPSETSIVEDHIGSTVQSPRELSTVEDHSGSTVQSSSEPSTVEDHSGGTVHSPSDPSTLEDHSGNKIHFPSEPSTALDHFGSTVQSLSEPSIVEDHSGKNDSQISNETTPQSSDVPVNNQTPSETKKEVGKSNYSPQSCLTDDVNMLSTCKKSGKHPHEETITKCEKSAEIKTRSPPDKPPDSKKLKDSPKTMNTMTAREKPVACDITVKVVNNEKPVDLVEPAVDSQLQNATVGEIVNDLLNESSANEFHSIIGKTKAVSKQFAPKKRLLGKFDEYTIRSALPREPSEREMAIEKSIQEICGMTNREFQDIKKVMGIEHLKKKNVAHSHAVDPKSVHKTMKRETESGWQRIMIGRFKKRMQTDPHYKFAHILKYRGDKFSFQRGEKFKNILCENDLKPGETLVYTVRLYKPFNVLNPKKYGRHTSSRMKYFKVGRGTCFQQDFHFLGSQMLYELRDCIRCPNDVGPQEDLSDKPDDEYIVDLKRVFPSGFLFINNVFYNDLRDADSVDISEPIRIWAKEEGLADLRHCSMEGVTFDMLKIRLGHPELYLHQGECEHLFTFSKVRVLQASDVCVSRLYPYSTGVTLYNSVNCIICTKIIAKWIVIGCERIPFDPAYLCGVCFKQYLYADGKKLGNFQAYRCQIKNMQVTDTF